MADKTERDRISRVLIVEDDQAQQFTLASIMEREGFEVIACGTATEALQHVRRANFGVAVVDLRLPDLEGTQLLEKIHQCNGAVCVIIHTAFGSFDSAKDSVNKGAFAYIEKASDPNDLVNAVHRAFRERMHRYAGDLESSVTRRTKALRKTNEALVQEINERKRTENLLQIQRDLAIALSSTSTVTKTLDGLLDAAFRIDEIDCGGVYFVDQDTGELNLISHRGLSDQFVKNTTRHSADSPQAWLVMAGKPVYWHHSKIPFVDDIRRHEGLRALVIIPVVYEGQAVASLNIGSHTHDEIPASARNALEAIAAPIGSVIARVRAATALRESEERFRTAFEQAAVGVAHLAPNGRWLRVNQKLCDIIGLTRDELLHRSFQDITYPDDLDTDLAYVRRMLAGELSTYSSEKRYVREDGSCAWINATVSLVREPSGNPKYFLSIVQDITERKQAEEERERLETELRQSQKMEAVGSLAAGVAHDFNNCLTAILGYADVARLDIPEGNTATQALDGIEQAAKQASGITQSLLTLSRKGTPRKSPVHLGKLVEDSARMLRSMLPTSIEILVEVPSEECLWVDADATQLQQVMVNLAINARDAMKDEGHLWVSAHHQPASPLDHLSEVETQNRGVAVLMVEDTGTGMSEEVQAHIFEPFFTTKPRERGTGLGMAIVHRIVTDCHGQIEVGSREGHGTRITIAFPCCEPPASPNTSSPPKRTRNGQGETVIVVDDEPQVLAILTSSLRSAGYDVVHASDGDEASSTFDAHRKQVQLVVLDLDLPKKSGLVLLQEMRAQRPDLPAILVTGNVDPDIEEQLDSNTRLLRKPFRMSELAKLASEILSDHRHHATHT